jgi:hypothetical protein
MEARVQALLEAVDDTLLENVGPYDILKLINSLKLSKACGTDGIPNECLRHLPRRPLVHLTHLFNHCLRLSHFPKSWKDAKIITLPKPSKDLKFPQVKVEVKVTLRPTTSLSVSPGFKAHEGLTTGYLFLGFQSSCHNIEITLVDIILKYE